MRELQHFQVAVKAFLLWDDRLLLVREAAGEQLWELPGGRIEVGEEALPLEAILHRELTEELGPEFDYEVGPLVAAWIRPPDPPRRVSPVFLLGYRCRPLGGEIRLSDEHIDLRWVTQAESARLATAPGYGPPLERFWRNRSG